MSIRRISVCPSQVIYNSGHVGIRTKAGLCVNKRGRSNGLFWGKMPVSCWPRSMTRLELSSGSITHCSERRSETLPTTSANKRIIRSQRNASRRSLSTDCAALSGRCLIFHEQRFAQRHRSQTCCHGTPAEPDGAYSKLILG